jgi:hypothetical protein
LKQWPQQLDAAHATNPGADSAQVALNLRCTVSLVSAVAKPKPPPPPLLLLLELHHHHQQSSLPQLPQQIPASTQWPHAHAVAQAARPLPLAAAAAARLLLLHLAMIQPRRRRHPCAAVFQACCCHWHTEGVFAACCDGRDKQV